MELYSYATLDKVCDTIHKVESRLLKHEFSKPPLQNGPFNKGSSNPFPDPMFPSPFSRQRTCAPKNNLPPQSKPKPIPKGTQRCLMCQGFGHLAADYTNCKFVTLAESEATKEVENGEQIKGDCDKTLEEIVVKANEGELLTLGTNHPPKSHKHVILFLTTSEPLPKVSNPRIRTFKEWNLDTFEGFSQNLIQTSINFKWRGAFKTKRDSFKWLVLFQPKLKPQVG